MKKRWSFTRILNAAKRGVGMTIVTAFVLMPLALAGVQYGGLFKTASEASPAGGPERNVLEIKPLNVRQADRTDRPLQPFDEPVITVTFDDGWESIYTASLPQLQYYGIPTTQYVLSGVFQNPRYMTAEQIKSFDAAGHEIACHTIDHSNLTTLTAYMVDKQLRDCQQTFQQQLGKPVTHFASPYGASSPATINAIQQVYATHRNTNGDITTNGISDNDVNTRANINRYSIVAITIRRDTTLTQLQAVLDYTVKNKAWLVLNYHNVEDDGSEYGISPAVLEQQLEVISQTPARIVTVGQFMDAYDSRNGRQ